MYNVKPSYGVETRVFVISDTLDVYFSPVELMNPLKRSINEYLDDLPADYSPMHVFLHAKEHNIFGGGLYDFAKQAFAGDDVAVWKAYMKTLQEQRIDIRAELREASNERSDVEAREYLRKVNLRLRQHLENFPTHYNNPVRLKGKGGSLRKPKFIHPIPIVWP
jgi:hypothetical protein